MAGSGSIKVQVYSAGRALPIPGASVTITDTGGEYPVLLAYRETDGNGIAGPVTVETPEAGLSAEPSQMRPYSRVNVQVDSPLYNSVLVENVQVFPDEESLQLVEMIPIPQYSDIETAGIVYDVPSQDL